MSKVQEIIPGWFCSKCGAESITSCKDYKDCDYMRLEQFEAMSEQRPDLFDMGRLRADLEFSKPGD